jgi:hypothetical protein
MSSVRLALSLLAAATIACSSSSPSNTNPMPDASSDTGGHAADAGTTTWDNYAEGFFKTYCVACHNASTMGMQNFNLYADVKGLDQTIRCGVTPKTEPQPDCASSMYPAGQFPIGTGAYPSDADRLRIVAWINAGAPEN